MNNKKIIFIRGHQGSGKTTKAKEILEKENQKGLKTLHLENDIFLMNENNQYEWNRERLALAKRHVAKLFKNSLDDKKIDTIIVSNMFVKKSSLEMFLNLIKSFNKKRRQENQIHDVQILRMSNGFENIHNVPKGTVNAIYLSMEDIDGEILIEPIKKIEIEKINRRDLEKNTEINSYITKKYIELYEGLLFNKKESLKYKNLYVLKYKPDVFFNNDFDDALLEMRGLIVDEDYNIVVRPFKKIFNYSELIEKESNYHRIVDDNMIVNAVVKVNGFLGVCTYSDKVNDIIYSTTGSTDSDFSLMVESHCKQYQKLFKDYPNHTFCFEINDENDKHIIKEDNGETLIGCIRVKDGYQFTEDKLNDLGKEYNIKRPEMIRNIKFKDLKELLKKVNHEGFMVFDENDNVICKMKSPFYLATKFLARGITNIDLKLVNRQGVDEDFYPIVDHIKENLEKYKNLNENERVEFITDFFNNKAIEDSNVNKIKNKRKMKFG